MSETADLADSKMVILNSGNVGIGTPSPSERLTVQSRAHIADAALTVSTFGDSTESGEGAKAIIYLGTAHRAYPDSRSGKKCAIIADGAGGWGKNDLHFCLNNSVGSDSRVNSASITDSKMVILNSGNVGIGTTSPSHTLDVSGNINATGDLTIAGAMEVENVTMGNWTHPTVSSFAIFAHSGNNTQTDYALNQESNGATTLNSSSGQSLSFRISHAEKMVIDSAGKVGIGTASPSSSLHVAGDRDNTPNTKGIHMGMNSVYEAAIEICAGGAATSNNSYIDFTKENVDQRGRILYSFSNDCLTFWTATNSASAGNEKMRITSAGNVGIGTASPSELLTVQSANDTDASFSVTTQDEYQDAILYLGTPSTASSAKKCAIIAQGLNSYSKSDLHFCLNSVGSNNVSETADLADSKMVILNSGNVGIGTPSPSERLTVQSRAHIADAALTVSTFGDSTESGEGAKAIIYLGTAHRAYPDSRSGKKCAIIADGAGGWGKNDLHFCLNNSVGSDSRVNSASITDSKMVILNSGNVGIGTTEPNAPLHVASNAGAIHYSPEGVSSYLYAGGYYLINTSSTLGYHSWVSGSPSVSIHSEGSIVSGNQIFSYSDERIKKNIVDLSDNEALETLRLIQPKKYEYVDQISRTNNTVYGYIAQQIQEVLPYAVGEIQNTVPNIYNLADISSEIVYTEASDISAVSTVGISTIYVDVSNVNTNAEVSMNVVMVEQSDISQNAVFSEAELEDGTKVHKLTFNDGYNTASLHESSNILRVMDASNQEYHITITNIETSYRLEIEEDLSGLVNAQGELFVAGQRVPQNVYKLVFPAFDTATLDASSTTLKLVDASDVTQYVSIASVLDSSTLQIDDDLQYMVLDSSSQLFVYGQKVSKSLTSLTFDGSYNVSSISENLISLKVLDTSGQPHDVKVYSKESDSNRLLLDEDISGKISYGASGELFVQGQNMNTTKHILTIQNYDTANLDASSTTLCLGSSNNDNKVSIVSVIDGSNIEISEDPTSFAHEGQVFVYGQKVDDFHALSKEYINVVTLSAVQELDRALTKVTQEKDELQTKYDVLEARVLALEGASST